MKQDMQTSMIGEIIDFYPATQTATIKLLMNAITSTEHANYNNTEIAELVDVPCQFQKVNGFSITTPVKQGDVCIVYFMGYGIQHWLYRGDKEYKVKNGRAEPAASNKYSINDAIAIVGLSNFLSPITNFNSDDLELRNTTADQRITLKSEGTIEIDTSGTILTINPDGTVTLVASTSITLDTPLVTATGNLSVTGNATVGGTLGVTGVTTTTAGITSGSIVVTGVVIASGNVVGAGKSIADHTHQYTDDGNVMTTLASG